jgi:predicted ATPase
MIQTNWHVITGGPSSGKTTLINRLAEMGYKTSSEIARAYLKEQLAKNHLTVEDIKKNMLELQRRILSLMLEHERELSKDDLIFFDRGTPDSLAYFRFHHFNDEHVVKACQHLRYKKVFFCHQLPVVQDGIRDEDDATAKMISKYILTVYKDLNYDLIELPPLSIEERMQIILTHVEGK